MIEVFCDKQRIDFKHNEKVINFSNLLLFIKNYISKEKTLNSVFINETKVDFTKDLCSNTLHRGDVVQFNTYSKDVICNKIICDHRKIFYTLYNKIKMTIFLYKSLSDRSAEARNIAIITIHREISNHIKLLVESFRILLINGKDKNILDNNISALYIKINNIINRWLEFFETIMKETNSLSFLVTSNLDILLENLLQNILEWESLIDRKVNNIFYG